MPEISQGFASTRVSREEPLSTELQSQINTELLLGFCRVTLGTALVFIGCNFAQEFNPNAVQSGERRASEVLRPLGQARRRRTDPVR